MIRVNGVVVELLEVLTVSDEREVVLLRRIDIKLYVQVYQLLDGVRQLLKVCLQCGEVSLLFFSCQFLIELEEDNMSDHDLLDVRELYFVKL